MQVTVDQVRAALDTEITVAHNTGVSGSVSSRKLTYDIATGDYNLWIAGHQAWVGSEIEDAVKQFNQFDAGTIDYTVENLAYAGI